MSAATWPTSFLSMPSIADLGVVGHGDLDVLRNRKQNRVRKTEAEIQILTLHRGLETDAFDLEVLGESFAHALHHVVDQARERPCSAFTLRVSASRASET